MKPTILATALLLAGCMAAPNTAGGAEPPRRPPDLPGIAYAQLGETIRVGALMVRPRAVVEDSRCPVNVDCVWAGRVVLRIAISGVREERLISSIEPLLLPDGGTLVLENVWPPRVHGEAPAGPYRFGFRVAR
ncbi:MAG: hypothetical protein AB7O91_05655 [Sphingomonas sp.]